MTLFAMPGHLIRRLQQRSNQVFQEKMKQLELDITSVQFAAMHALYDEKQMEQEAAPAVKRAVAQQPVVLPTTDGI